MTSSGKCQMSRYLESWSIVLTILVGLSVLEGNQVRDATPGTNDALPTLEQRSSRVRKEGISPLQNSDENEPSSTPTEDEGVNQNWLCHIDPKRYFRITYPNKWTLTTGNVCWFHYYDGFLSLNNFDRDDFWLTLSGLGGSREQDPPLLSALPPGSVYLDMSWFSSFPGYADEREVRINGEMTSRNLAGVLEQSSEELIEDGQIRFRYISFCKWRRRWCIRAYMREPFREADTKMMDRVLKTFRFDAFPVGDELWAVVLAREHLRAADANLFPLTGSRGYRTVRTAKKGDEVIVTFDEGNPQGEPEKLWQFRVTPLGDVIVVPTGAPVPLQRSPWGAESGGLEVRITARAEIEQGMPLEVTIRLRCIPERLEPGVEYLNPFLYDEFLELSLRNAETQDVITVRPWSFADTPAPRDRGRGRIPLNADDLDVAAWDVRFPLVRVRDSLEPGSYECRVEYSVPEGPSPWWSGSQKDWERSGFWHGRVVSGPLSLTVLKEAPTRWHFVLPRRLQLEEDGKVCFRIEDADNLELPVRNGFFVGTYVYGTAEKKRWLCSGTPAPHNVGTIAHVDSRAAETLSCTIELFETSDALLRPYHPGLGYGAYDPYSYAGFDEFIWNPGSGSGEYKVLWKRTFNLGPGEDVNGRVKANR
jgi:hypothetical protein